MKQILQNISNGQTEVANVPRPDTQANSVLIVTRRTLISAGTERMLVDFGKANWIDKARQQPDKVKQVVQKIRTDGLGPTLEAVRAKLDAPLPMGYCNSGTVVAVGAGVTAFKIGQRVASNGKHAEVVAVPQTLCVAIPDSVDDDSASFTVLGAIALQGIRLLAPSLGECVVVTGLGLIGLITVQLLKAHGCRVLGIDMDPAKLALAREFGAETVDLSAQEDPIARAAGFSRGRGVDGVIVTASTKSSEPMHQAATMCRKRGRIILVGVTGLELSRADFYEKELTFQVSCSYGPGRYDPQYEEKGHDYPLGYVRWTEQRNFEAFLDMVDEGRVNLTRLISHRYSIGNAAEAYSLITSPEQSLGVIIEYPGLVLDEKSRTVELGTPKTVGPVKVAFIGSGNYASQVLIPAFAETKASLQSICSMAGVSAMRIGRKFGIATATTSVTEALHGDSSNTVVISTRHDSHAEYVCAALDAGKHVFVEKPLALTDEDLGKIKAAYARTNGACSLMVGFNRRFAPHIVEIRRLLASRSEPPSMIMTVNAGAIPAEHWTQDPSVGGGRIIGEGCHFVDLLRYLAGSPINAIAAIAVRGVDGRVPPDTVSATLHFANGAVGTIHYFANGSKSFPKERLEVFCGGGILQLDNFRSLTGYGWPGFSSHKSRRQDKGNRACVEAFVTSIAEGRGSPIAFNELVEVQEATMQIAAAVA
jgi:predicted dehydrogenase/threonine dehydrogenase-like Zn-dependent dehydrogenase